MPPCAAPTLPPSRSSRSATCGSTSRSGPSRSAGEPVQLTPHEFALLRVLARNPGKLLTHAALLREVWGRGYGDESHYLHVYVSQLRRKLEADPARPRYILTEPGAGYRLAERA